MKVRVTEQIRDDFKVASFHKLDLLKLQIKNLNNEIEILKNVKNVDELCEKNKKIPQRKLELIKF